MTNADDERKEQEHSCCGGAPAKRVQNKKRTKPVVITVLAVSGGVLLIAAHGFLIAWAGNKLTEKNGGWLLWIAGGALMAFGLWYMIQKIRRKGHGDPHLFGGHMPVREKVERGPHGGFLVNLGHGFIEITIFDADEPPRFRLFLLNQRKQPRSVPRNATMTIETIRPDGARQTFAFSAKGEYVESENAIPEPHEFKAILQVSHGSQTHLPHEVQFSKHSHASLRL